MTLKKFLPFLAWLLFSTQNVSAQEFKKDCAYLARAFLNSKLESPNFEKILYQDSQIPEQFRLNQDEIPWAASYWPFFEGGVARRWQSGTQAQDNGAHYIIPGASKAGERPTNKDAVLKALKNMSQEEIDKLSPTEKFDLYLSNYRFSITHTELTKRGPLRTLKPEEWEGFCNGRCAAGLLMDEPKHVIEVMNEDGILLKFQPNDLKALLSASYFYVEDYVQIGAPFVKGVPLANTPNAASFDILIRKYLGEKRSAFVADIENGPEIWNHLIVGYERSIDRTPRPLNENELSQLGHLENAADLKAVDVKLTLEYIDEVSLEFANQPTEAALAQGQNIKPIEMSYTLFVDSRGHIQDGRWTGSKAPDFVWFPGGRGMDQSQGMNPHISFDHLNKLNSQAAPKQNPHESGMKTSAFHALKKLFQLSNQ